MEAPRRSQHCRCDETTQIQLQVQFRQLVLAGSVEQQLKLIKKLLYIKLEKLLQERDGGNKNPSSVKRSSKTELHRTTVKVNG